MDNKIPSWIESLADRPAVERLHYLQSNADEVREGLYYREFTEDEMESLRISNAATDIELRQRQEELARATLPIKERIKELTADKKATVTKLKEKREEIDGELYVFHDFDTNATYELDKEGNIINHRIIAKRQRTTFQQGREQADGTNGQ